MRLTWSWVPAFAQGPTRWGDHRQRPGLASMRIRSGSGSTMGVRPRSPSPSPLAVMDEATVRAKAMGAPAPPLLRWLVPGGDLVREIPRGLRPGRTGSQVTSPASVGEPPASTCHPARRGLRARSVITESSLDRPQHFAGVFDHPGPRAIAAIGFLVQPFHKIRRQPHEHRLTRFLPPFCLSSFHLISP